MSKDIGKLAGGWIRRLGTLAAGLGLIAGVAPVRGESLRALGWDRAAGEVHLFRLSGDQPATPIRTAALADSIRVVTAPGGPVLLPASRPPTGAAKGTLIFDYNPALAQSLPLDVAGVKSADGIPSATAGVPAEVETDPADQALDADVLDVLRPDADGVVVIGQAKKILSTRRASSLPAGWTRPSK